MRQLVKKDLGCKAYKMQKRHKLDEKTKAKRLARARLITGFYISWEQKQLRFGLLPPSVVWSDEKVFAVEEKFNQQNDRIYCVTVEDIPDDLRYAERQQSPASIMVWACVTSCGKKGPLIFIQPGVKIDQHYYLLRRTAPSF